MMRLAIVLALLGACFGESWHYRCDLIEACYDGDTELERHVDAVDVHAQDVREETTRWRAECRDRQADCPGTSVCATLCDPVDGPLEGDVP